MLLYVILCLYFSCISSLWIEDTENKLSKDSFIEFTIALKLNNIDKLHQKFLEISSPSSLRYGQYYSLQQIFHEFGPKANDKQLVIEFIQSISKDTKVQSLHEYGDMFTVKAPVHSIEDFFKTKLVWMKNTNDQIQNRAIRAKLKLQIPIDIANKISFISLDIPVTYTIPRSKKHIQSIDAKDYLSTISVSSGNEAAIITFTPVCGDGSTNQANPPCSNLSPDLIPTITVTTNQFAKDSNSNEYTLTSTGLQYVLNPTNIFCSNTAGSTCTIDSCTCKTKVSPLPKYTQLQMNVTFTFPTSSNPRVLGVSSYFYLTDVITPSFLSELYQIPIGTSVKSSSNQSVAEFYEEYYSNSDLSTFLAYVGLPDASIPIENVFGDLPNNENKPGGEAQLDVEYIMGIAPKAETFFYSFSDLNPYSPENEGFLAYLTYVNNQEYPPLVHSLSYGDIEADVYDQSDNNAYQYAVRCDEEFMKLGLRGLTILFASGDEGIGSSVDCNSAHPEWPTSSGLYYINEKI